MTAPMRQGKKICAHAGTECLCDIKADMRHGKTPPPHDGSHPNPKMTHVSRSKCPQCNPLLIPTLNACACTVKAQAPAANLCQCMAREHSWKKWQDIWNEPEGPHPRSKHGHQPNDENGNGHKSRSSKKPRSADHPFYTKHRPDNADPAEWKIWVDEAEPDYSEDDESVAITQGQFNDFQWKYNDHRQEAMKPQMPAWIVNNCIRQLQAK